VDKSERIIRRVVWWAVTALYHRVEVRQEPGLTATGPEVVNSSHFGGFTDPLLLIYAMDRVPRYVARDVIWKYPVAKSVMEWVRAIPVHKADDGGPTSNEAMFVATYDALAEGDLVTIFPEGITVDDPSIAPVKTGSARIALGARASGVAGIRLVSAGIHYANKAALRTDVFIDIGWVIDLDAFVREHVAAGEPEDASNRELVRALTERIDANLREAAPDFESWAMAHMLASAADVALRTDTVEGGIDVGYADKERLARLLDEAPYQHRQAVSESMATYQTDLDAIGLDDEMLMSRLNEPSSFVWYAVRSLLVGFVLLPFALAGLAANAVPMAIVWSIGRRKVSDAMMATIKPIGAITAFGLTWGLWAWLGWRIGGWGGAASALLLLPVFLFALMAVAERVMLLGKAIRGFRRSRSLHDVFARVKEHRRDVVEAVARAA